MQYGALCFGVRTDFEDRRTPRQARQPHLQLGMGVIGGGQGIFLVLKEIDLHSDCRGITMPADDEQVCYGCLRASSIPQVVGSDVGQTLAQVGSFDERYFMYCEEIDLCRRIKTAGWTIYCLPEARIVHLVAQSTRQFRDRMFVALWRSRFLMFEEHEGATFCWAARRLVGLGLWAEARRARSVHRRGEIDDAELAGRLAAYREVAAL